MGRMVEESNTRQHRAEKISREQAMAQGSTLALLLFVLLQLTTPSSGQSIPAMQPPNNLTVAVGDPAVFSCGVNSSTSSINFTLSNYNGMLSFACPSPCSGSGCTSNPFRGTCTTVSGMNMATWTNSKASISDNSAQVACQQAGQTYTAFLYVYEKGNRYAIIIGCAIGGFIAALLIIGASIISLRKSERVQKCFRGAQEDNGNSVLE